MNMIIRRVMSLLLIMGVMLTPVVTAFADDESSGGGNAPAVEQPREQEPDPTPKPAKEPTPEPAIKPTPEPTPEPMPNPTPSPEPTPELTPEPLKPRITAAWLSFEMPTYERTDDALTLITTGSRAATLKLTNVGAVAVVVTVDFDAPNVAWMDIDLSAVKPITIAPGKSATLAVPLSPKETLPTNAKIDAFKLNASIDVEAINP